ncbi:hypothetical protein EDB84DRAFT_1441076 [Lactarius hengduanensis]|nr:hypothetical protein EDB84DRAFT_1441076 [Lactarius hengduanensis]
MEAQWHQCACKETTFNHRTSDNPGLPWSTDAFAITQANHPKIEMSDARVAQDLGSGHPKSIAHTAEARRQRKEEKEKITRVEEKEASLVNRENERAIDATFAQNARRRLHRGVSKWSRSRSSTGDTRAWVTRRHGLIEPEAAVIWGQRVQLRRGETEWEKRYRRGVARTRYYRSQSSSIDYPTGNLEDRGRRVQIRTRKKENGVISEVEN